MLSANLNLSVDPAFVADQMRELPPTARSLVAVLFIVLVIVVAYVFLA